jgi:hypothetical protein
MSDDSDHSTTRVPLLRASINDHCLREGLEWRRVVSPA